MPLFKLFFVQGLEMKSLTDTTIIQLSAVTLKLFGK